MDRYECHVCLCHGSWGNLCRIHQWVVLWQPSKYTGTFILTDFLYTLVHELVDTTQTIIDTNIRLPTTKLYWQHISRTWLLSSMFCKQIYWIQEHVFIRVWHSKKLGMLLYVIFVEILFWAVIAGILHQLGIYWKLWTLKIMNVHAVF